MLSLLWMLRSCCEVQLLFYQQRVCIAFRVRENRYRHRTGVTSRPVHRSFRTPFPPERSDTAVILETGCGCGNRERKIWDFLFRVVFSHSLPEKDIRALSRALGCPRKNGAEKMQKRRLPQAFDLCLSL